MIAVCEDFFFYVDGDDGDYGGSDDGWVMTLMMMVAIMVAVVMVVMTVIMPAMILVMVVTTMLITMMIWVMVIRWRQIENECNN